MATVDEAGAIVVSMRRGEPAILLVTAKRNPQHWIFPKGHVERGETLEAAALREAEEEAGVSGTVLKPAGESSFRMNSQTYRVHYFVIATRDEGRPEAGRRLLWCTYDEASARLTFEDSRALLRDVWPEIRAQLSLLFPAGNQ